MNRFNPKSRSPKRKKLQSCEVCENNRGVRGTFSVLLAKSSFTVSPPSSIRSGPATNQPLAKRGANRAPAHAGGGVSIPCPVATPASHHAAAFSGIERQLLQCLLPEKKHCNLCLKRCTYRFCDCRLQHRSFFILLNLQTNGKLQRKRHTRSFSNF